MSEIDLNSIVKDGEIEISERQWVDLNNKFTQSEIIDFISTAVDRLDLQLPLRKITRDAAVSDFTALRDYDCRKLWKTGNLFTKHNYALPLSNKYIEIYNVGSKAADIFHQESRFRSGSANSPSPQRIWTTADFRKNLLKSLWSMKYKKVDSKVLRQALALRGYVASQFRPSAAKAIYELLESKDVLDFASGWGGRLTGFCAAPRTKSYYGCDPNENLFEGYKKQMDLFGRSKKITVVNSPAEELNFGKERFDTVFTSPPYFRAERYTHDENQSWRRYRSVESWLNQFLFRVIENSWRALKPRGFLVINLADVYHDRKVNKIVDAAGEFILRLPRVEFVVGVGLRMQTRPRKALKDCIHVEPIWIFRKQN